MALTKKKLKKVAKQQPELITKEDKEKQAEAKKSAREADRKKVANEIRAKADKIILDLTKNSPAGSSKTLMNVVKNMLKLEAERKAINLAMKDQRNIVKQQKVDLRVFDQVFKLFKMDPIDRKNYELQHAYVKEQLDMELMSEDEKLMSEAKKDREQAREATLKATGGDTGTEIGSGTASSASAGIPAKNEDIKAAGITH